MHSHRFAWLINVISHQWLVSVHLRVANGLDGRLAVPEMAGHLLIILPPLTRPIFIQAKHPISSRKEAKSSVPSAASTSSSSTVSGGPLPQEEDFSFFLSPEFEQLLVRLNSVSGFGAHRNEAVESSSSSGFAANTGYTSRLSLSNVYWNFCFC